jgi:hypothetical protein
MDAVEEGHPVWARGVPATQKTESNLHCKTQLLAANPNIEDIGEGEKPVRWESTLLEATLIKTEDDFRSLLGEAYFSRI